MFVFLNTKHIFRKRPIIRVAACFLCLICLLFSPSCDFGVRKRPFGFMRLGNILDLRSPEVFLQNQRLLLRHDKNGYYVMSLSCTYDSSLLTFKRTKKGQRVLVSSTTKSVYDENGRVLRGPARANLPFYKLKILKDPRGAEFLVAIVGNEVSEDWRFKVEDMLPPTEY